jgi:Ca2+-binding RTX toxin-like protein
VPEGAGLTSTGSVNATGNALANVLTGNSGANVLNGGTGADAMSSATGNDTYVVEDAGDTVIEAAATDTDAMQAWLTYALTSNVEYLTLIGTGNINGTGNDLSNVLTGNGGRMC